MPSPPLTTAQLENQLVGTRAVTFQVSGVPPPSALYITQDDQLQVITANSLAGQSIIIVAQLLLPDGRLQANQWQVNPAATRALATTVFPLGEGYLINVSVIPTVSPTRRGQTWIQVGVRRGGVAGGQLVQTLIADYVDTFYGGTWPGGRITNSLDGRGYLRSILGPTPAVGANILETVPPNAHWVVQSMYFGLQTSATAGNRQMSVALDDGANIFWNDQCEPLVAANTNVTFCWGKQLGWAQTTAVNAFVGRSLPEIRLGPGFHISTWITAKQAGDALTGLTYLVEEFMSP
jgi:hypothetical protein